MRDRCAVALDLGNRAVRRFTRVILATLNRDAIFGVGLDPDCLLRGSVAISSHGFISHDANLRFYYTDAILLQTTIV